MGAQCAGGGVAGDESERGGWACREEAQRHCESSSVRSLAAPAPAPSPTSAPPIPPPRFRERDKTELRLLVVDPHLLDLQRATVARVCRFRHVPVESWLPAQRDPADAPLFNTRT